MASSKPSAARCPNCGKPSSESTRPFCSERCQSVDLNRWLSQGYRIETEEKPDPLAPPEDQRD